MQIKLILNRCLSRLENITGRSRLRVLKTLYLNFRLFPFYQAIKLPVFVYGRLNILSLAGSALVKGEVKKGMIRVGENRDTMFSSRLHSFWCIPLGCKLEFNGPCSFGCGHTLRLSGGGKVEFGRHVFIASSSLIACARHIKIGDYTQVTFRCTLRDTNFHYMLNTSDGSIHDRNGEIIIGRANWIGNGASVTKGTVTPDYTIVAAGSLLNKDYYQLDEYDGTPMLLAGTPAKIRRRGDKEIICRADERMIDFLFRQGQSDKLFVNLEDFDYGVNNLDESKL